MKKEIMLWSKDKLRYVKASKIREIAIYPDRYSLGVSGTHAEVKGWFNENEYFDFGWFDTTGEAKAFVDAINARIEERVE